MKQKQIEENLGPMKLIFNYEDVFYSFFYDDISVASIARESMR